MSIKSREILVVSFGTTVKRAREQALDKIAEVVKEQFPEFRVVSAYTSGKVRAKIERETGEQILSPREALAQAAEDKIHELYVLPTHLMDGIELKNFRGLLGEFKDKFAVCKCAGQLLETDEDHKAVAEAVRETLSGCDSCNTESEDHAVVLIGHGTLDAANVLYTHFQSELEQWGFINYVVGTIEATPDYEEVLARLKKLNAKSVTLVPFLLVAGDHALNDIGGDDEESWQSRLRSEGFQVETLKKGLGEMPGVHQLLADHARKMINE